MCHLFFLHVIRFFFLQTHCPFHSFLSLFIFTCLSIYNMFLRISKSVQRIILFPLVHRLIVHQQRLYFKDLLKVFQCWIFIPDSNNSTATKKQTKIHNIQVCHVVRLIFECKHNIPHLHLRKACSILKHSLFHVQKKINTFRWITFLKLSLLFQKWIDRSSGLIMSLLYPLLGFRVAKCKFLSLSSYDNFKILEVYRHYDERSHSSLFFFFFC